MMCAIMGHRYRFSADGARMRWQCQRGCGATGHKDYPTEAEARRYAVAFDREDRADLGRRAPFFGMFPLRIWRRIRYGRQAQQRLIG